MRSENKGFTLIELAIVLVIIGFVIASGGSLLALAVKKKAADTDLSRIVSAKNSLFSYSAVNGSLPASDSFAPAVPHASDFGGRPVAYIYDKSLSDETDVRDVVCRRKTTSLSIRVCRNYGCTEYATVRNVAFVTVGGGANANIQTGEDEAGIVRIYMHGDKADDYSADILRVEAYDDIAEWVTLNELQARSGCDSSRLKILNNELPPAYTEKYYKSIIYADGGMPQNSYGRSYKWCIEKSALADSGALFFKAYGTDVIISSSCADESESAWTSGDNITIFGKAPAGSGGSHLLNIWVRDGNDPDGADDNIANKRLVLTVSD